MEKWKKRVRAREREKEYREYHRDIRGSRTVSAKKQCFSFIINE